MSMSLDADIDLLVHIPFFGGFSAEHLKLIAFSAESRSLPEKLLLYDEGQLLHSAYLVISGTMRAMKKGKAGAESGAEKIEGREIGPGVLLGERALILDTRATESVRVQTRSRVLQIRKALFRRLLQEYPEIAVTIRSRLTRNLLSASAEFNAVAARLAAMGD
jgi:CRP-like cAMP-binding protein